MNKGISNLKSLADRTPDERKKIAAKGGKQSGVKRRENARLSKLIDSTFERLEVLHGEELTLKEHAVLQAVRKAAKGNLEALALLAKLNGESKEQIQVSSLPPIDCHVFGDDL